MVTWQRQHGRHGLPWQRTRDPYRVWLSEIMLQQTQVATVLGYYDRFLQRFPTVAQLAAAPLDDVLALWSGLGYYSRARNLHRCAQAVAARPGGTFPRTAAELETLPGIGATTAAAIASFCFDERVALFDGNVKRVLARWAGFDRDLAQAAAHRALWQQATALLPPERADMPAYSQGLMDLGATLCSVRRPQCERCPLATDCVARAQGRTEALPVKSRRQVRSQRDNAWLWLQWRGRVWLQQRPARGVWAGLWSLPLFDTTEQARAAARALGLSIQELPPLQHALTHFDWTLRPLLAHCPRRPVGPAWQALEPGRWVMPDEFDSIALPAPLRRLLSSSDPG